MFSGAHVMQGICLCIRTTASTAGELSPTTSKAGHLVKKTREMLLPIASKEFLRRSRSVLTFHKAVGAVLSKIPLCSHTMTFCLHQNLVCGLHMHPYHPLHVHQLSLLLQMC